MKLLFALLHVSVNDGPYTLLQNGVLLHLYLKFFTSIHSRDTNISIFKTNGRYVELYFQFRF